MSPISYWLRELGAAKKREKDFRKEGEKIISIYGGKMVKDTPFNILYSNTETLLPAVYSNVPIPVVSRRFRDDDPLGKHASEASQRCLKFLLDTNIDGYETFDEAMKASVLDALLPGRGICTVKYDADVIESEEGDPQEVSKELVCCETRPWNKVYFGYAKKWSKVPWIAFEEHIDKEEAERLFDKEIANKLVYTNHEERDAERQDYDYQEDDSDEGAKKTTCIYVIWDKDGGRKIRYVSEQFKDQYLKEVDDPLGLTGFYNMPKPIQFLEKNDMLPKAIYELYQNQAKELNNVTKRISTLVGAIKARAIYDGSMGDDIKRLMDADEGEMVPADTASALSTEKGLQNAIWFWPVDKLIVVLRELIGAREQIKATIYEITGISDILRGSTVASETATAQKIKSQWGSLRLKRIQKEVQRYSRDLLRMMLEVAATKFSEETWAKMTGLPFNTTMQAEQMKMLAMQAQMVGQQIDPQTQARMNWPVWGDVLKLLRDDIQRAFRIDIETNSTVEVEATDDKEQMAEVMNAMGQALNGLTPLVSNGTLPFQAAQAMLLTIVRRFRFGAEIEDMIKAMVQPQPPDAKANQLQQQLQQVQQQGQQAMQQAQKAVAEKDMELAKTRAEAMAEKELAAIKEQSLKLDYDRRLFAIEKKFTEQAIASKVETVQSKLQGEQKVAQLQNSKFKTENVVNQKADARLGESAKALESIVGKMAEMQAQLMQVVAQQSQEGAIRQEQLLKAITAPKKKTAVRGKDGRLESVLEEIAE